MTDPSGKSQESSPESAADSAEPQHVYTHRLVRHTADITQRNNLKF